MSKQLWFDTTDAESLAASDSVGAFVRAGTDGTLIGHVSDALKVSVANATLDVTGSTVELGSTTLAALETITVDQGTSPWVVSASQLDIDDLDYTTDNVAIKGATGNQLVVNADGSLNVNADISVSNGSDKAEDAAHASGDIGTYILAVRQDTLASSVSADGDYASLKVDAQGALYTNISNTITTSDAALANTAIASASKTLAVADTAEVAVASPLSNRKYLFVKNNSNSMLYVGGSGVTESNGYPLSNKDSIELRAGAASGVYFVFAAGKTGNIRTLELS
jgi:hypothetical protein